MTWQRASERAGGRARLLMHSLRSLIVEQLRTIMPYIHVYTLDFFSRTWLSQFALSARVRVRSSSLKKEKILNNKKRTPHPIPTGVASCLSHTQKKHLPCSSGSSILTGTLYRYAKETGISTIVLFHPDFFGAPNHVSPTTLLIIHLHKNYTPRILHPPPD